MTMRVAIFRPPHARNGTMFDRRLDVYRRCQALADVEVTIVHDEAVPFTADRLATLAVPAGPAGLPRALSRTLGMRPYQRALAELARFDLIDTADPSRYAFTTIALDAVLRNGGHLVCSSSVTLPVVRAPLSMGRARRVLDVASAIVCTTPGARERFESLGLIAPGDARAVVTGHPVDADRFCPSRGVREPIVLSVCRLDEETGVFDAIDAFAAAPASWSWWIVGDGPQRPKLESRLAERGLTDRVRLLGRVDYDGVPALYNKASILLHLPRATRNWEDYFGAVAIEAMACGLPIVAKPTGVIPWVTGDVAVLTGGDGGAALRALCGDESRRADLGARGRARVRAEFHIDRVAGRLLRAWTTAVESPAPVAAR